MDIKLFDICVTGGIVNYVFPEDQFLSIFTQKFDEFLYETDQIGSKRDKNDPIHIIDDRIKQGCVVCFETDNFNRDTCHIIRCPGNHVVCQSCARSWFGRKRICPAGCGFSLEERYRGCLQYYRSYDLTEVRAFFEELRRSNFDFDNLNSEGFPPLIVAIINRRVEIIKLLIEFGANPDVVDIEENSALFHAMNKDLDEEPEVDDTEDTEHEDLIPILLEGGASVSSTDGHGYPVIHHLIETSYESDFLTYFIETKRNLNIICDDGFTLIGKAFINQRDVMLQDLCYCRTSLDIGNTFTNDSPIQVGIENVDSLISFRILFDIYLENAAGDCYYCHQNNLGFTDLHTCVNSNKPVFLNFFLNFLSTGNRLDENTENMINVADNNSQTPLFLASSLGHTECVRLLLRADADSQIRNSEGVTPKQIAAQNGNQEIIDLFEEFNVLDPVVLAERM